jgi:hypothetical protein
MVKARPACRVFALAAAGCLLSMVGAARAQAPDWVAKSNANAQPVLELIARFNPEAAGSIGVDGLDEDILDLGPGLYDRNREATEAVLARTRKALAGESDPKVRQDLGILIQRLEEDQYSSQLDRDNMLPYYNVSQTVFQGIRGLIDPQIPAERYPAAVVRLRKYAGMEAGFEPITDLARARTQERFDVPGLTGPYRGEVEQDLARAGTFIAGLEDLLAGAGLEDWEEPYAVLSGQLRSYNEWLRAEMLPRAREDFRLPLVMYQDALKQWGVDASPEALIEQATQAYMDIRNEMMALAPLVAADKGYEASDYREVIRLLKNEQIPGDDILEFYRARLGELEDIIRREKLVSLPDRQAGIRIGSAAETAAQPSPHLDIPRLIGNTGEYPDFVLPLLEKDADGRWKGSDDTYDAGSWTLTAHEARPGHELQFSSMLESGVSITRALFAFNSANVEGWALYAEAIAKPYMPLDGQLISLQFRLARAARMFLDPMLNLGLVTPDEARRLLTEDVVLSDRWAQNEIERYTYRIPGQATAYYYGYAKMQALRAQTELAMNDRFDQQAFHDFVLAQGLLPPRLLKAAVMEEFVPSRASAASGR